MLRPAVAEDRDFLYQVYASTRAEEMAMVPWCEAEKTAFLQMQFMAQTKAYTENYPGADFSVIMVGEIPVGRLAVYRRPGEIRIMDIALLPDYRGWGIGGMLLQQILDEGKARGIPVSIHVESYNPAQRLYERLGFRKVEMVQSVYYLMEWRPEAGRQGENHGSESVEE
jgi:ribosomal protein S18 acetylase RimI-like enzyme